ncbi:MAG: hypothetical protein IJD51_00665 [Clostridia bacterium]|nr:hypothetical protein [Clostridia bacterium]
MRLLRFIYKKGVGALFWLAVMLAFDSPFICILTLIAAAIHECGHIIAARALGRGDTGAPRATLDGFKIDTGATMSYRDEAIIAAAGPFCNLLTALVSLPFCHSGYALTFLLINLLSAISNLLPLTSYDGGRIIGALLRSRLDEHRAASVTDAISLALSFLLSLLTLMLIMYLGEGYWLFGMFFAIFLREILKKH